MLKILENHGDEWKKRILYTHQESFPFEQAMLFGAGHRGKMVARFFQNKGIKVLAFFDNDTNKHGTSFDGIPILPPDNVLDFKNVPLIVTSHWEDSICLQMMRMGLTDFYYSIRHTSIAFEPDLLLRHGDRIDVIYSMLHDEASRDIYKGIIFSRIHGDDAYLRFSDYAQYDHPLVTSESGDIVLDIGGLDGETSIFFSKKMNGNGHIYCFEPYGIFYDSILERIRAKDTHGIITPIKVGAWSETTQLRFQSFLNSPGSSRVDPSGDEIINVTTIDSFVKENNISQVDLLKADIEGAEMDMLYGATETIKTLRPKLQISIYHGTRDLWRLQEYIDSLRCGYAFFVGQHRAVQLETVLYAITKESLKT